MTILLIATNVRRKWNTTELLTIALNVKKMKTKEEIEKLAQQDFNERQECGHYELADLKSIDYYYDGFYNGYNQCQLDMADKLNNSLKKKD